MAQFTKFLILLIHRVLKFLLKTSSNEWCTQSIRFLEVVKLFGCYIHKLGIQLLVIRLWGAVFCVASMT